MTALHLAAMHDAGKLVSLLLDLQIDIMAQETKVYSNLILTAISLECFCIVFVEWQYGPSHCH